MKVGEPVFKKTFTKPLPKGAKVFSRKHVKYARFMVTTKTGKKEQTERVTRNDKKLLCETSHWYIRFNDNFGIRRVLKSNLDEGNSDYLYKRIIELVNCLSRNEPAPVRLQQYLEQNAEIREQLVGFGLLKSTAEAGKSLDELVEDFRNDLIKKERLQRYIEESARILRTVFAACNFVKWTDIKGQVVKDYLDERRDGGKGISKRRYNIILGRVQQFCRWYVRRQKQGGNLGIIDPTSYLDAQDNPQTDARHERRVLELDDFRRFLFAALTGPKYRKLTGRERNFVYRLAAETAMRKVDFIRLRVKDIDFDNDTIRIQASRIKNKAASIIYLKPERALELKQYCKNKLPEAKVFDLPVHLEQAVRFDLAKTEVKDASGKVIVPAIPYKDTFGRVFDFHSLRHESASLYGMNAETPEAVRQQLTRHKTTKMVRHYTHASETQQRRAVEALPDLTTPGSQSQVQVRTGTDKASLSNACFITDSIRQDTTQDDNAEKNKPVSLSKNGDFKKIGGAEKTETQSSHLCTSKSKGPTASGSTDRQSTLPVP